MSVEVEHISRQTEERIEVVGKPTEDEEIIDKIEEDGHTWYKVKEEIVVTEEQYIVITRDGTETRSRTYYIHQEDGEWYVSKIKKNPVRGHVLVQNASIDEDVSTRTVREELEEYGVEVVN